jgi:uncharacterized protein (TIGR03083 family)
VNTDEYLEAIVRESTAMADAAERAGLDAPVRSCPGWTVADLVEHVGNVQRWAALTVRTRPTERINRAALSESPSAADLVTWFRAASDELVEALRAADPAAPVWTFLPDGTVAFWFRRQAQEVAVHRWDAERATGDIPVPLERVLAADGIDEWLALTMGGRTASDGDVETLHLHCTDLDDLDDSGADATGEWLITLTPDGATIEARHAKGDVAARGSASDLDLFVWGRVDADVLDVFGDAALLERFRRSGAD